MTTGESVGARPVAAPAPHAQDGDGPLLEKGADGQALPFSFFLGLISGLILFTISRPALLDGDLYWHLLAGAQLASGTAPDQLGLDWSFAPSQAPWTSTQWLSELLLYLLHSWGGWAALAAFRVGTAAVALAVLAMTTLRGRPAILAAFPYTVAAAAVAFVSQERPQQFTLIAAAALGGVLVRGLYTNTLPRWWVLLPLVVVWANLHGGWILAPFILGLVSIGRMLDHRRLREPTALRALALAVMALIAGAITPSGLAGITATLRFSSATENIIEWRAVEPVSAAGIATVLILGLIVLAWSRPASVPPSEIVAVLVLTFFMWAAWRNVAPGLALIAPMAATRLTTAFPGPARRREPTWAVPAGIASAIVLTLVGLATVPGREHLPYSANPVRLAERVSQLEPGQRVLDDYNVAGLVLYFGGPQTQVAIDGRADRYGAEYIRDYLKLENLQGDWEELLNDLNPTSALIERDSALSHVLVDDRGWQEVDAEGDYVLLVKPDGGTGG